MYSYFQWDNWHALKAMEKGLRALFGQDEVFSEKIHKVKSHVSWLLKTSKITIEEYLDDEKRKAAKNHIQKLIMQVCRHFQGVFPYSVDANGVEFHADCHPLSRCKVDENYVNSSVFINAGEAEKLEDFLENSDFMKNTDKFLLGKPTIYLYIFQLRLNCPLNERFDKSVILVWTG